MVYIERQFMAVRCQIAPGGFSGERIFIVQLADGSSYKSLAPRRFCWNGSKQIVENNEPTTTISGFVAARIIENLDDNQSLIEVPDGEIIAIDKESLVERPTPIQPIERRQDVPV
jgi:hypothetical protein